MKVLNISGGATKIAGLYGKAETVVKDFGYKPNVITGVSSGALLALPIALGMWDVMKDLVLSFNESHVFDISPSNKKGKMSIKNLMRVISGKSSLGRQKNLYITLSKVITKEIFKAYVASCPIRVFIGVSNFNTGEFELIDLKKLTYSEYLKYTVASTSIPFAVEPVLINGNYYYDGGVIHHTCSTHILKKFKSVSNMITIFSRPESPDLSYKNFNGIDISQVLLATTNLQVDYLSLKDQEYEKVFCELNSIPLRQLFCPKVMQSMYDMNPERLRELYEKSKVEDFDTFKEFLK